MKNPLLDKDFLLELDKQHNREVFARILALNFSELPIEKIEGRVTGGSISIDGTSTVRRSCNLSLIAEDVDINDFYWGLSNKFSLEIGITNKINSDYPDIIWFNQGIFIITSFSTSYTTNNYTISISGKDKMCTLNGEVGGSLPASIDFGTIEAYDTIYAEKKFEDKSYYKANTYYIENPDFTITNGEKQYILSFDKYDEDKTYYEKDVMASTTSLTLKSIIREAVHTYGFEPYRNIVINDLDQYGLELLEYRGDKPIYFFYRADEKIFENTTFNGDMQCYYSDDASKNLIAISNLNDDEYYDLIDSLTPAATVRKVRLPALAGKSNDVDYIIAKIEYGQTAGYRETDLTYNGDLISNIGESLTSILDKIKNMLGDFEYFYDIDGHFVFQEKKTYVNTSWNTIQDATGDTEQYVTSAVDSSSCIYSFTDSNLVTSFSNNPNLLNVRNDYSVFGQRETASGAKVQVHMRYSIHEKPEYYKSFDGHYYISNENEELYKLITTQKIKEIVGWDKIPNPDGLQEAVQNDDGTWTAGWWEVQDWAQYYKKLTGAFPTGVIERTYAKEPCYFEEGFNMNDIFPEPDRSKTYYHCGYNGGGYAYYDSDSDRWVVPSYRPSWAFGKWDTKTESILIFEVNEDNTLGFYGHLLTGYDPDGKSYHIGCGCDFSSYYSDNQYGRKFYVWNPQIPLQMLTNIIKKISTEYIKLVDWREIIYQMACDFYKYSSEEGSQYKPTTDSVFQANKTYYGKKIVDNVVTYPAITGYTTGSAIDAVLYERYYSDNFLLELEENNKIMNYDENNKIIITSLYPGGITQYEPYYIDMQGFWRQLYNPDVANEKSNNYDIQFTYEHGATETRKVWSEDGSSYTNVTEWVDPVCTAINCDYYLPIDILEAAAAEKGLTLDEDTKNTIGTDNENLYYWNRSIIDSPEMLNFWIDFLDNGDLTQYSIANIGHRPKAVNDNDVTAIYFRETPQVIFINRKDYDSSSAQQTAYKYVGLADGMMDYFHISAQGKSAKDEIDSLLYQYAYCTESITLNTLPIYYLSPNTRIYVYDKNSGINGEYIVSKFTLPLTYNGTMSITADKAVDRLY